MKTETTKAIAKAWAARWGNIKAEIIPPIYKDFKLGFLAGVEHEKEERKDVKDVLGRR